MWITKFFKTPEIYRLPKYDLSLSPSPFKGLRGYRIIEFVNMSIIELKDYIKNHIPNTWLQNKIGFYLICG